MTRFKITESIKGIVTNRNLMLVLLISASVRAVLSIWQSTHGIFYDSNLQTLGDFYAYYGWEVKELASGLLPYRDFAYTYPPAFLYSLFLSSLIHLEEAPIVLADILSAPLVYLIVAKNSNPRVALVAGLLYALGPYFLIYEGYAWLSEQPMLFFLFLSIYLLKEGKFVASSVVYALAVLFKQDALFVLPVYVFWMLSLGGVRKGLKSISVGLGLVLVVSLPFLILVPVGYIVSLAPGIFHSSFSPPILPPNGGGGGIQFTSTILVLPQLTCSNIINDLLEVSQICVGSGAGTGLISNHVLFYPSPALESFFTILVSPLLLLPVIEFVFVPRGKRMMFSFALSYALILVFLLASGHLQAYKYYALPLYGLLLISCEDYLSLGIASIFPIVGLLSPSFLIELVPLTELQCLVLVWVIRSSRRYRNWIDSYQSRASSSPV